ncbi:hypothetical protein PsYK624_165100 [Phanerochaete sordida]|uniref:Uncharacterized protein n=1 Tax=Phanerochaete sordida TaxID=48140 RepID=A0A9P3GTB4_9APHY|nr:hypothetical protein PsYK624_165100 [Phanerochaete sordida]
MQLKTDDNRTTDTRTYPHPYDDTFCVCLVHPGSAVHHVEYYCGHEPEAPPSPPPTMNDDLAAPTANAAPAANAANPAPAANAANAQPAAAPPAPAAGGAANVPPPAAAAQAGQPQQPAAGNVDVRTFLNAATELLEGDPYPPPPVDLAGPWWVVYSGSKVGVLRDWNLVALYTHGVSRNRSRGFGTWEAARDSWIIACVMGTVHGSLSEHALFPFIVTLDEAARRMQEALGPAAAPAPAPAPAAAAANDDNDPEDPPAWVVIRGLRPGVQYFR